MVTIYVKSGIRYIGIDFMGTDFPIMWDGMMPNAVVIRPELWRALKAVKLKARAKRRARARMRSRGYVAHGRRG